MTTTTAPAPRHNEFEDDKLVLHQDDDKGTALVTDIPDSHRRGIISDNIPSAYPPQEIQSEVAISPSEAISPSSPFDDPSPVVKQEAILPPPSTTFSPDNTTQDPCPTPPSCPLPPFRLTQIQQDQWSAARILHQNAISACLAGSPVSYFYGSGDLWVWVPVLVEDTSLNTACELLIKHGYEDISGGEGGTAQDFEAPEKNEEGAEALKWRFFRFAPPLNGAEMVKVILIPSSHWRFDITPETTILVDGIPIPKLVSYIHALTSLLADRSKSGLPTGHYNLQLLSVWTLRSKYPTQLEDLPPADRFFIEKYPLLKKRLNKRKLVELWEKLTKGEMKLKEAEEKVPVEWRPPPRQGKKG